MYHCHLRFYFTGQPCRAFEVIKEQPPLESFFHEFFDESTKGNDTAIHADVMIVNVQGGDVRELLGAAAALRQGNTQLIALAEQGQMSLLSEYLPDITDIWILPMSDEEIRFRFLRWQQNYKMNRDFWETSQYFESTINSIPSLVWYKDKEGIHRKVNDSFCRTVNKEKSQVEGRDHAFIWDVDTTDPANADYDCSASDREVMQKKETCVSEETVKTGDGEKLLITYKSPLYDLDGSVMGTLGVGIDITQERAYEQEIISKNNTLETIFTTLECGVLCHTLDGKHILRVNEAALSILGYESQEALIEDGFDVIAPSVLDEDKPKLRKCIQTLKKEGDSVNIEYRVQHKDGEIIYVMGNIKLIEEKGSMFYQRFLLDCTAQKLKEEENKRQQAELMQALSIDYNLIFYYDLDTGMGYSLRGDDASGRIFDPAFVNELSLEESMERYIDGFVYENDKELMRQAVSRDQIKKEMQGKNQYYINYRTLQDDEMRYYEMKVVRAGSGKKDHGIVLGIRNVDEETRNEMEQKKLLEDALLQANRANKAKSAFLSNMSHDIRTPMNAIMGFTTLAIDHIDSREQVHEYLKKIKMSGNHLLGLINDVLDMSRIENGKMRLEEAPCALSDILHGLKNIVQADVRAKWQVLNIDMSNVLNENVYCDTLKLNQVLLNLLSNAIKYTKTRGQIDLTVTEQTGAPQGYAYYKFCIRDTGIGMSSEFLSHIFEPFERERNTTISGIQGTGLGMAITKNIVDLMNGTIDVKSELGVGTEITVTFPLRQNAGAEEFERLTGWENCRALVVDADSDSCQSALQLLEQAGLRGERSASAEDVVSRVGQAVRENDPYDLFFIDGLPDMGIMELTGRIHEATDGKGFMIVLSADDWTAIEDKVREAGVCAFCSKPLFFKDLQICLDSIKNTDESQETGHAGTILTAYRRILLVEDNELNQEIATAILQDAGLEIEVAENGQIAVDMLKDAGPDYYQLVLMDIQMPVMDGYEAAQTIRRFEDKELASIPILAMTANAFEEDRQEALRCGMNGHIAKPIDVSRLFDMMDQLLR